MRVTSLTGTTDPRTFDIWVMICFGLLGYALRRGGYPIAPLVLGLVLGGLLDSSLRRGLVLAGGDVTEFFTRPISAVLASCVIVSILLQFPHVRRALGLLVRSKRANDRSMDGQEGP